MVEDAVGANHESDSHSNTNNEEDLKNNDEEEDEQGEVELVYWIVMQCFKAVVRTLV